MTLARRLVRAARRARGEPIPPDVLGCARLHLLDAIGVGLASAATGTGRLYLEAAPTIGGEGAAHVLGARSTRDAATAALLNGGLIHGLEFDDTHLGSIVHGSSVLAPLVLAVAEEVGTSGRDLLETYVLGWEALVRIGLAAPGGFQARGFQVTPVGGALIAALMAVDLMRLDEDRAVAAIGIALSQASGVFEFLTNGSSVKSLHPGWAAHAGIIAAKLAAARLTGPETSIEGRHGLFHQFATDSETAVDRLEASLKNLGSVWHLREAAFKLLPCCHYIHPYVEALEQLMPLAATDIHSIRCLVAPGAAAIIAVPAARKIRPATGHEARWSLPVVLASRILEGPVGHVTFAAPPCFAVLELARRVACEPMGQTRFPDRFEAEVIVSLTSGREHRVRVDDVLGGPTRPAPPDMVQAKFRANVALFGGALDAAAIERAVERIEDNAARDLGAALTMRKETTHGAI
jgi:2-methylcitrate dehydratase PrpD